MGIVFGINIVLTHLGIDPYMQYAWLSPLMHTLGGFVTTWSLVMLFTTLQKRYRLKITPEPLVYLCLVAVALSIGVVWEWYEFLWDTFFGTLYQPTIIDTMTDLCMDMIGAALFVLFFLSIQPKKRRSPLRRR